MPSQRVSKRLRRENTEKKRKVFYKGFGPNRKRKRDVAAFKERDFTKPNVGYRSNRKLDKNGKGKPPFKGHLIVDYSSQREDEKIPPKLTNHVRHRERQLEREMNVKHSRNMREMRESSKTSTS